MNLSNSLEGKKIVAHYVMYTHDFFFEESVESVIPFVDLILIARTTKPWFGKEVDLTKTNKILDKLKAKYPNKLEIFKDKFENEQSQRNFLIEKSHKLGHDGAFIIDCDEIFIEDSFNKIYEFIAQNSPKALRIPYLTFIKDASFVVAPPYEDGLFYIDLKSDVEFSWARNVTVEVTSMPYKDPKILHFSYLRESDEAILNKVKSFMHIHDTDWDYWYNNIYLNVNPNIQNFHPVWPERWKALELFDSDKLSHGLYQKLLKNKQLFFNQKIKNNEAIKLHLGCGPVVKEGYVNIDLFDEHADIKMDITNLTYFETNSVDEIYMNAVFEHLYTFEQDKALAEWFRVLKKGGKLIINATPDFDEVIKAYINKAKGNCGEVFNIYEVFRYTHGDYKEENKIGQIHKDIFTKEKMRCLVENAGFEMEKIESICWGSESNPVNLDLTAVKTVKSIDSNVITKKIIEAETLIGSEEYPKAKIILQDILLINDNNIDALNDLAVITILENDFDKADKIISLVLQIDSTNEVALGNLEYIIQQSVAHIPTEIEVSTFSSYEDFKNYSLKKENIFKERALYEKSLVVEDDTFTVPGYCKVCERDSNFLVDYLYAYQNNGTKIPNWRERIVCPVCGLNNRMRAAIHLLNTVTKPEPDARIYISEQTTQLYRYFLKNYPNTVGSEYLGAKYKPGEINEHGIRNEDFTNLTFVDNMFDLVLSFEVFEHVPDFINAFSESLRVLKPGGHLIFTVPFNTNAKSNLVRAVITNGIVEHIHPPEYHGDPVNSSEGCLCYYHFGWEVLEQLKTAGFENVNAMSFYSKEFGYLGGEQLFFVAEKSKIENSSNEENESLKQNNLIAENI